MSNARVWLNGQELGGRPYGYIGFAFDLTPHLHFGAQENVLAVRLTPEDRGSRWYPGAGIYRNVWLDITGPVHVGLWGTYVTTPEVTDEKSTVAVKTEVHNSGQPAAKLVLRTSVLDAAGKQVASVSNPLAVPGMGDQTVSSSLSVPRPQRWDIDHPYLYTLVSEVLDGSPRGGPLHHALRHSHRCLRPPEGLSAERPACEDPGRLRPLPTWARWDRPSIAGPPSASSRF